MGYNIPEKIFDQHMHIVRDVHFDVDKYKVNELYVIKHTITNAHTIDGKMVGKLIKAEADALTFDIFTEVIPEGVLPTDPHNYYSIKTITLFIDDIIEKKIEIERLMTESEADFRTTNTVSMKVEPEGESVLADKYKGDLSIYTPLLTTSNPSSIDQMILSNKSRLKSDIQAAYKIDTKTAEECIDFGEMAKDVLEEDPNIIDKNQYVCYLPTHKRPVSFINENGTFAHELFNGYESSLKVTMTKGDSEISIKTSVKNLKVDTDIIAIRNGNHTVSVKLHKDSFYKIYDNIKFEP